MISGEGGEVKRTWRMREKLQESKKKCKGKERERERKANEKREGEGEKGDRKYRKGAGG